MHAAAIAACHFRLLSRRRYLRCLELFFIHYAMPSASRRDIDIRLLLYAITIRQQEYATPIEMMDERWDILWCWRAERLSEIIFAITASEELMHDYQMSQHALSRRVSEELRRCRCRHLMTLTCAYLLYAYMLPPMMSYFRFRHHTADYHYYAMPSPLFETLLSSRHLPSFLMMPPPRYWGQRYWDMMSAWYFHFSFFEMILRYAFMPLFWCYHYADTPREIFRRLFLFHRWYYDTPIFRATRAFRCGFSPFECLPLSMTFFFFSYYDKKRLLFDIILLRLFSFQIFIIFRRHATPRATTAIFAVTDTIGDRAWSHYTRFILLDAAEGIRVYLLFEEMIFSAAAET